MKMNYHLLMNEVGDGGGAGGSGGSGAAASAVLNTPTPSAPVLNVPAPNPAAVAAAPAAQPPNPPSAVTIPDNWKDALPQELRELPTLKAIHNIADLVKTMDHGQRMIGRPNVPVIDWKTATETDKKMFYEKLGLPQKIEEYSVETPKGARFADGFLTQFKETAFKAGVLPHQMNEILSWYHQANEKALNDFLTNDKAQEDQRVNSLKTEWGNDFARNAQLSNGMLAMAIKEAGIAADEVKTWLDSGAGNDPMLIKLLFGMSKFVKEDVIAGDGSQLPASTQSIKDEINSVMGDVKHPFHDKLHPNHRNAVQQMETLFQKLHPPKPQMQNAM